MVPDTEWIDDERIKRRIAQRKAIEEMGFDGEWKPMCFLRSRFLCRADGVLTVSCRLANARAKDVEIEAFHVQSWWNWDTLEYAIHFLGFNFT